jgi:uncharacterized phage protein (TIGR01671 family)
MNREIKFRAWDLEDHLWWGSLPLDGLTGQVIGSTAKVALMQYTGLHDSKGVEIYEGDIIATYVERTYKPGNKSGMRPGYKQILERKDLRKVIQWVGTGFNIRTRSPLFWHEVIGNIYENGDLLK